MGWGWGEQKKQNAEEEGETEGDLVPLATQPCACLLWRPVLHDHSRV